MDKTLRKINRIFKRTAPQIIEDTFETIDGKEIVAVFKSLEKTLKLAFEETGPAGAAQTIATIHHNLFENAVYRNSEKARLSLLFLKSNLSNIAKFNEFNLGLFLYSYSKAWFKFFISLEAKANLYISWIDLSDSTFREINYSQIIDEFDEKIPSIDIDSMVNDIFNEEIKSLLMDLVHYNTTEKIGSTFQGWIFSELHNHVTGINQEAFKKLILMFFQFPADKLIALDEIIHEYGKAWYRHSLELKKWFLNFSNNLEPQLVERMWRGMFWSRLTGQNKTFREVINEWREKHKSPDIKELVKI